MSIASLVRDEISKAEVGTYFAVRDVVARIGERHAVELAMTRAAAEGDIVPVRRGLYWKGTKTRFGSTRPDTLDAAIAVARASDFDSGVGPTGWSASHVLGLSTQIPAMTYVAVPGRPPAPPSGVQFHQRSSRGRVGLGVLEVALLEVLAQFPSQIEASWDELVNKVRSLVADAQIDLIKVAGAASKQHSTAVRSRTEDLLAALGVDPTAGPLMQTSFHV